jgi:hypothetical protein
VLAVGGTSLIADAAGNYQFEAAWSGSGGGYSRYSAEPNYQRGIQATGKRGTPDVAFDGDPATGVQVYETSLYGDQGSWQVVGGTSLGTPAWAAILAIADQGRALAGLGSLDGASQTLPTLYALRSTDFHAVSGLVHSVRAGSFNAALTTGLGSPVGPALVADLVASTLSQPLVTSAAAVRTSVHSRVVHFPRAHLPGRGAKPHRTAGLTHPAARTTNHPSTDPRESARMQG